MTRLPRGGTSERWISGLVILALILLGLIVFLWR